MKFCLAVFTFREAVVDIREIIQINDAAGRYLLPVSVITHLLNQLMIPRINPITDDPAKTPIADITDLRRQREGWQLPSILQGNPLISVCMS